MNMVLFPFLFLLPFTIIKCCNSLTCIRQIPYYKSPFFLLKYLTRLNFPLLLCFLAPSVVEVFLSVYLFCFFFFLVSRHFLMTHQRSFLSLSLFHSVRLLFLSVFEPKHRFVFRSSSILKIFSFSSSESVRTLSLVTPRFFKIFLTTDFIIGSTFS